MSAATNLTSLGFLACAYGVSVETIRSVFERLGLQPAQRLNGVPYYDEAQVEQLLAELERRRPRVRRD